MQKPHKAFSVWLAVFLSGFFVVTSNNFSSASPAAGVKTATKSQSNIFGNISYANTKISGFATKVSILPGQPLVLKIEAPQTWNLKVYRQGYYKANQSDEKLIYQLGPLAKFRQPTFIFREGTRTVDAGNWKKTLSIPTKNWQPGLYVVKLKMSNHFGYIPFLVRTPNLKGKSVYVSAFQTMQAYNNWGGFSAYKGTIGDQTARENRSVLVTFNRPWGNAGIRHLLDNELGVAQALERYGTNIGWTTDFDVSTGVADISKSKTIVSSAHDEYWSPENRQAYDRAIANGTNVMIMGGNNSYWRIRYHKLEEKYLPSFYIYKSGKDPIEATSPELSTKFWRADPGASPESLLTASMYNHSATYCGSSMFDAQVVDSSWFGFKGTAVKNSQSIAGIAMHEMDQILPNSKIPAKTQVVLHSDFTCIGKDTISRPMSYDMVYYTTSAHSAVFSAGSTAWGCTLSPYCASVRKKSKQTETFVRQVTKNLLVAFNKKNVGILYPSTFNVNDIYPGIKVTLIK